MSEWGCTSDRFALRDAQFYWDKTYRLSGDERAAYDAMLAVSLDDLDGKNGALSSGNFAWVRSQDHRDRFDVAGEIASRWLVWAKWADGGYPILTASKSLAAAMMCTDTAAISAEDIRMPWRAVVVVVPDGILRDLRGNSVDRILLERSDIEGEGLQIVLYSTVDESAGIYYLTQHRRTGDALLELLKGDILSAPTLEGQELSRTVRCAGKYAVGLLVSLQYGDNFTWRDVPARPKKGPWSRTEPRHRVAAFGRQVSVDFSDAVAQYVSGGKRGLPSVQTMVRGHYKRQVFGLARSSRKVIWVEPYWRGPEDAPIIARPLRLADPRAS